MKPLYTVDNPKFILSNQKEESICARVKKLYPVFLSIFRWESDLAEVGVKNIPYQLQRLFLLLQVFFIHPSSTHTCVYQYMHLSTYMCIVHPFAGFAQA